MKNVLERIELRLENFRASSTTGRLFKSLPVLDLLLAKTLKNGIQRVEIVLFLFEI